MSSWLRAKSAPIRKQVAVSKYHNTAYSGDIPSIYLDFMAIYSYTKKTGETCNILDLTGIIKSTLAYNPEVRLLKEVSESSSLFNIVDSYKIINQMKFSEIQKFASNVFTYDTGFNQSVIKILEKASIKSIFDIGIHLTSSINGNNISRCFDLINEFQKKSKKAILSIYVMTNSYSLLTSFKNIADSTWKITSLTKNVPLDASDVFVNMMAEVQVMTVLPALILDFYMPIDRFIYMMHRNMKDLSYFKEVNNIEWSIQQPIRQPTPTPLPLRGPAVVAPAKLDVFEVAAAERRATAERIATAERALTAAREEAATARKEATAQGEADVARAADDITDVPLMAPAAPAPEISITTTSTIPSFDFGLNK